MKKLVVLLTLVAAVSGYSQGTINFQTKLTAANIDAPIAYGTGGPATAGTRPSGLAPGSQWSGINALAGLYGGPVGTTEANLVLLVPSVGFRTGAAAGYVNVGSSASRDVAGTVPGGSGVFQIRAWDTGAAGSTWETLPLGGYYAGKSAVITVTGLGGGSPPASPANLIDSTTGTPIAGFSMAWVPVPEPSIIGLGLLGAVAGLMVFRRRN